MVKWCPSVCYVKDDVLLSTIPRQSQLLRHCKDFRYSITINFNIHVVICIHLSLSPSLSLSLSHPPSLHFASLPHYIHIQGKNLEGCYLLLRYPENPMLASSSSSASGGSSSSKRHGPVNGNECYYWRTSGCAFGAKCRFRHVPSNRGIDSKNH